MVGKILVTGGCGFIGSHLVKKLVESGADVVVPYVEFDKKSYFFKSGLHLKTRFEKCNLVDFGSTLKLFGKYKIDYVYHLAALPIVEDTLKNPVSAFEVNTMGTVNVLESSRVHGRVLAVVVCSTDKAYGKTPRAIETKPLLPDHPYETSKAAADLAATTYFKTFGLPVAVTRFGNVYGEGDLNFSRIIPGIMQSKIQKKTLGIRSNGRYRRDYVYAGDVVDAMVTICANIQKVKGEAFNVSSFENFSVLELIKKVDRILGTKTNFQILKTAVNEIPNQSINFNKIKKQLSWKPKRSLDDTIVEVHQWYKSYFGVK